LNEETNTMASQSTRNDGNAAFSFGVRELREAQESQRLQAMQRPQTPQHLYAQRPQATRGAQAPRFAAQIQPPVLSVHESVGADPYNTSGSFDRAWNWARVGKR
jgi:hypothetical protein